MYCVVQKIQNKKQNVYGEHKEIEIHSIPYKTGNEHSKNKYYYRNGDECFDRPILDAYKISIHKSYRENGAVKKKQWSICTMGYYNFIDSWPGDFIIRKELDVKLANMEITEEELWDLVYEKLTPLQERIKNEFATSDEAKAKKSHEEIFNEYWKVKRAFEDKHGEDTYDYCYDVLGILRSEKCLKQLEDDYKSQQQYRKSSYYENSSSNYSDNNFSGYSKNKHSNYTEEEKENLKKMYKVLAFKYHPDHTKDDGMMMRLVNKVKEEWGI